MAPPARHLERGRRETLEIPPRRMRQQRQQETAEGGEHVVTGLAHTRGAKVAYDPASNQEGCEMRSRKLAALSRTVSEQAGLRVAL